MRKVIAAINMTLDGYCDHTSVVASEALHRHYTGLLKTGDVMLLGRKTFELMQYWQTVVENPTGTPSMDEFAMVIDSIPKIVFSNTLDDVSWHSAGLAAGKIANVVQDLRQQPGKHVLVGSRSLILQLLKSGLIDELRLCVHPVLAGSGLPLFDDIKEASHLILTGAKPLEGGAIVLHYEPVVR